MSGGHYDFIHVKEEDEFLRKSQMRDFFQRAAEEYSYKGYDDIAEEFEEADKRLEEIWEEVREIKDELGPLFKAMSWLKCGDYGENTFKEAVEKARSEE